MKLWILCGVCVGLVACAETTSPSPCGDGEPVAINGASYCVYEEAIVIVGGFDCPASMRFRMDFNNATVCGDHAFDDIDVPNDICARVFVPCTEAEDPDAGVGPLGCGGQVCSLPNATSECQQGVCTIATCDVGFGDCDANPNNGCEASLDTLSDCGTCGTACSGDNATCASGTCSADPPLPARDNCMFGLVQASRADCEATPLTCYALPSGETCGVCTSATLDCTLVDCADYSAPVVPSPVCLDGTGAWEGTCGSVRYRSEQGGYGGAIRYWDIATGKLVAAWVATDTNSYCDYNAFVVLQGDPTVLADCDVAEDATTSLCGQ